MTAWFSLPHTTGRVFERLHKARNAARQNRNAPPPEIVPVPVLEPEEKPLVIRARWRDIVEQVAREHDCSVQDILSRDRRLKIAAARHDLCYRLDLIGMSLPHIGSVIGRDHTSVLHAIRAHAKRNGIDLTGRRGYYAQRRKIAP